MSDETEVLDQAPDADDLSAPPVAGDETATLLGALERQRATFAWKVSGLDAGGLTASVGASSMTLGGLVKHLAFVEDLKFTTSLLGQPLPAPWDEVDWDEEPEWPWTSAADDSPDELYGLWRDSVQRSRTSVAATLADGGLGVRTQYGFDDPEDALSLRRLLVDVLEEYARHVGHADLIREAYDGSVGEDPPELTHPYEPPQPRP